MPPKTYTAYGLTIGSEIELPLPRSESGSSADIAIGVGRLAEPDSLSTTNDGVSYSFLANGLYLKWGRIGSFLIENGSRITVSPGDSHDPVAYPVTLPLLGTVMAIALFQRGTIALHGSCIEIGAGAVIFVGEKGEGKSTMASYLLSRGHRLLSDDICPVHLQETKQPKTYASFPAVKLWPDAMAYLNVRPDDHERVMPAAEKRTIRLSSDHLTSCCAVSGIVILRTSSAIELERLSGHTAFSLLLPHLLVNRYYDEQPAPIREQGFAQLASLSKAVPLYQLARPRDLERLPECADLLLKTFLSHGYED